MSQNNSDFVEQLLKDQAKQIESPIELRDLVLGTITRAQRKQNRKKWLLSSFGSVVVLLVIAGSFYATAVFKRETFSQIIGSTPAESRAILAGSELQIASTN